MTTVISYFFNENYRCTDKALANYQLANNQRLTIARLSINTKSYKNLTFVPFVAKAFFDFERYSLTIYVAKTIFCRHKLFLPQQFFTWQKRFFPPTGKNLPTLLWAKRMVSTCIQYLTSIIDAIASNTNTVILTSTRYMPEIC